MEKVTIAACSAAKDSNCLRLSPAAKYGAFQKVRGRTSCAREGISQTLDRSGGRDRPVRGRIKSNPHMGKE